MGAKACTVFGFIFFLCVVVYLCVMFYHGGYDRGNIMGFRSGGASVILFSMEKGRIPTEIEFNNMIYAHQLKEYGKNSGREETKIH